jgi:O-antigen/teichoic acid export membrane protein
MNRSSSNWDKNNFLRNSLFLGSSQLISGLLSAIFIWLLNYNNLIAELSIVVVFYTINQLCLIFTNWTQPLYIRDGLEYFSINNKLNLLFIPRLFFSIVIGLIIISCSYFYGDFLSTFLSVKRIYIDFALYYFIAQIVFWHLHNTLQSLKLILDQSVMVILDKLTPVLLFLVLITFKHIAINQILISIITGNLIGIIYATFKLRGFISIEFNVKYLKKHLKDSLPLIATVIVSFLATGSIDHFFIKHYLNVNDLVNYFIIFQFYGMYLQLPTVISSLVLNWLTSLIVEKNILIINTFLKNTIPIVSLLFLFLSLLAYITISFVLKVFYNINENQFQAPLLILMFSSVLSFINIIAFSPFILAQRNVKLSLYISIIGAIINLIGNYFLIFKYGIVGIAFSTFLSVLISIIIVNARIYKTLLIIDFKLYFLYLFLFIGVALALFFPTNSFHIIVISLFLILLILVIKLKQIKREFYKMKKKIIAV